MSSAIGLFDRTAVNRQISWFIIGVWVSGYLALVVLLGTFSRSLELASAGAVALVAALVGVKYTSRHREWLVFALLLSDQLLAFDLIPEQTQRVGHYLLAILICLPALPHVKRYAILSKGGFKLYTIYFCWAAFTLLYSEDVTLSSGRLLFAVLTFGAISVVAFEVKDREDVLKLFERLVLGCGVVTAVLAASAVVLPHEVTWGAVDNIERSLGTASVVETTRFRGIFASANQVGSLTLVTVGCALVCWPGSRGRKRLALALLMATAFGFGVLAASRTPLVALAVGGGAYLIWKYSGRGVLICAALALVLYLPAGRLMVPETGGGDSEREVATLSGRTAAWQFALEQVVQHPLTGFGYGIESQIFRSRYFPVWWGPWEEPRMSVHNGYLGRAVSVGVPALLFWMFICLRPWVFLFLRREDPWNLKPIALLVVLPILVHNLTESSASDFGGLIGLVWGLSWAIGERQRLIAIAAKQEEAPAASQPGAWSRESLAL